MTWRDDTIADIRLAEGCRLVAYQDGEGVWTIGYGHTAGVKPGDTCSQDEAEGWLVQDVNVAYGDLISHVPWFAGAPDAVKRGLLNMCFNLGWPRLSGFKATLLSGSIGDYASMADEALNSKWATQVGGRADQIAALFRSCANGGGSNV